MAASNPDAIRGGAALSQTLDSDHQAIISAVDQLVVDGVASDEHGLLATTLTAIEEHLALEETALHPLVKTELPNGESEVIRVMADAARIEHRVSTLRSPDLSTRQRTRLVADLRSLMHQHVGGHEVRHVAVSDS